MPKVWINIDSNSKTRQNARKIKRRMLPLILKAKFFITARAKRSKKATGASTTSVSASENGTSEEAAPNTARKNAETVLQYPSANAVFREPATSIASEARKTLTLTATSLRIPLVFSLPLSVFCTSGSLSAFSITTLLKSVSGCSGDTFEIVIKNIRRHA